MKRREKESFLTIHFILYSTLGIGELSAVLGEEEGKMLTTRFNVFYDTRMLYLAQ
jgi:hypothetical protein